MWFVWYYSQIIVWWLFKLKLSCVELFVSYVVFVEDIYCIISLIGVLLIQGCFVELPYDVVDEYGIDV